MKNHITRFFLLSLLMLLFGCGTPLDQAVIRASTKKTLLQAGFKSIPVTEKQKNKLRGFTPGLITTFQRHGTIYYLYPDLEENHILLGSQEDYARYDEILARKLTPSLKPVTHLKRDWAESDFWKN